MRLRREVERGRTAIVVGGGFIGSEIAAALNQNGVAVRMVYPESYLVSRVFPESLGRALQERFRARGVHIVDGDRPAALSRDDTRYYVRTESGNHLEADLVIVGIGITPNVVLAQAAGLDIDDGIVVDQYLQTSHPDIYAAGDNARFPYQALGRRVRVEHWDNGVKQGVAAGANMAAAHEPFTYMPYFYSDLFEFGYEAVGDVDSRLETFADWQKENDTGVIYYLDGDRVRGVMLCNVWGKLDAARELIRERKRMRQESLRGRIHG
jgi:NADPH-dependent 2,4-dienoyl-CoA reductase/sulfur reductase-like enzyme